MKKYIILFLLFVSISSYSQINNWINNDINYSFEDKEQVFKDPNIKDTLYIDLDEIEMFKGGVEYLPTYDSVTFQSIQPSTINQAFITFRIIAGDSITVFWGDGTYTGLMGTGSNQAATSSYTTNNTTYNIVVKGDLGGVIYLYFVDGVTFANITSSEVKKFRNLQILRLYNCGTTGHHIYSSDLVNLPLKHLTIYFAGTGHLINTAHLVGKSLDYFRLVNAGSSNIINTAHFIGMPLTYWELNNSGTNNTGQISDLPTELTDLRVLAAGQGISITSGTMKAWASTEMRLQSAYNTASVDGFLNAWATVAGSGTKTIYLAGTGAGIANEPRSSASDAAVVTLKALGKTIQTTP